MVFVHKNKEDKMQNYYLRNKIFGIGAGIASLIFGGCNSAPTARITEPDGTEVKPLSSNPYRFVLSINRDDIINGLEKFILKAKDKDGPENLKGTIYAVEKNGPVVPIITKGEDTKERLTWEFILSYTGKGNISRGTYPMFEVSLDDGYIFHGPVVYTVVADVSVGGSLLDDILDSNGDDMDDNGGGTPIEDLLNITYAEFVGSNGEPLDEITTENFRVLLYMPEELANRVDNPSFSMRELGDNPCITVQSVSGPREVNNGTWEVTGTLTGEQCSSPFELLEASFGLTIGNGNVFINDSLEAILR